MSEHPPFFGKKIARDQEQDYINSVLEKYKGQAASEELKEKIYNDLMWEKHLGKVTIPFKVVLVKDESGHGMDYIDVLLETLV